MNVAIYVFGNELNIQLYTCIIHVNNICCIIVATTEIHILSPFWGDELYILTTVGSEQAGDQKLLWFTLNPINIHGRNLLLWGITTISTNISMPVDLGWDHWQAELITLNVRTV